MSRTMKVFLLPFYIAVVVSTNENCEFENHVSIEIVDKNGDEHVCLGSALDKHWILFPSDCIHSSVNAANLTVVTVSSMHGIELIHDRTKDSNSLCPTVALVKVKPPLDNTIQPATFTRSRSCYENGLKGSTVSFDPVDDRYESVGQTITSTSMCAVPEEYLYSLNPTGNTHLYKYFSYSLRSFTSGVTEGNRNNGKFLGGLAAGIGGFLSRSEVDEKEFIPLLRNEIERIESDVVQDDGAKGKIRRDLAAGIGGFLARSEVDRKDEIERIESDVVGIDDAKGKFLGGFAAGLGAAIGGFLSKIDVDGKKFTASLKNEIEKIEYDVEGKDDAKGKFIGGLAAGIGGLLAKIDVDVKKFTVPSWKNEIEKIESNVLERSQTDKNEPTMPLRNEKESIESNIAKQDYKNGKFLGGLLAGLGEFLARNQVDETEYVNSLLNEIEGIESAGVREDYENGKFLGGLSAGLGGFLARNQVDKEFIISLIQEIRSFESNGAERDRKFSPRLSADIERLLKRNQFEEKQFMTALQNEIAMSTPNDMGRTFGEPEILSADYSNCNIIGSLTKNDFTSCKFSSSKCDIEYGSPLTTKNKNGKDVIIGIAPGIFKQNCQHCFVYMQIDDEVIKWIQTFGVSLNIDNTTCNL